MSTADTYDDLDDDFEDEEIDESLDDDSPDEDEVDDLAARSVEEVLADFEPMPIDDPRHRPLLSKWASEVKSALRSGALSGEALDVVRDLAARADLLPDGADRSTLLQAAHHVVRHAEEAARGAAPAGLKSTRTRALPDGSAEVRTTDQLGRVSVTVVDPAVEGESPVDPERPWLGQEGPIEPAAVRTWGMDASVRFRTEHPAAWAALLQGNAVDLGPSPRPEPRQRVGVDSFMRTALAERARVRPGVDTLIRNRSRQDFATGYGGEGED